MNNFFKIGERGSTVGTEVRAGITTFLAMAYIIARRAAKELGYPVIIRAAYALSSIFKMPTLSV